MKCIFAFFPQSKETQSFYTWERDCDPVAISHAACAVGMQAAEGALSSSDKPSRVNSGTRPSLWRLLVSYLVPPTFLNKHYDDADF